MASIQLFSNQAQTTLAGAITSTALTANLSPGSGVLFPSPAAGQYFVAIFNDASTNLQYEEVWVTNVTGDTITMLRGQEGSTAKAWSAGDIVFNGWTAGQARNFSQQAQVQQNSANYAADTGTANSYIVALTPAVTALIDGMPIMFKAKTSNTGASTITVNGLASVPIVGLAAAALQGGEIIANGTCEGFYNSTLGAVVLQGCSGGAQQVGNASQSQHALTLGQGNTLYDPIGTGSAVQGVVKNLKIVSLGLTNSTSVVTADQVILRNAAGSYKTVSSVNLSPNLANTVGQPLALSTGTWTASTWYYVYLWNNGTTTTATFDPSPTAPTAPAGYTSGFNALVGVVRTDSTGNKYILQSQQTGNYFQYVVTTSSNVPSMPQAQSGITGNISTPTWTSVAVGNYVPTAIAKEILPALMINGATGGVGMLAPNSSYGAYNSTSNPPPLAVNTSSSQPGTYLTRFALESTNIFTANNTAGGVFILGFTI